jgi:hypothetical protein
VILKNLITTKITTGVNNMSYLILPNRFFRSPLIACANFSDGSHVNLIRLLKPYANGISYGVHETTKSTFCSNGTFKSLDSALIKFELMVKNAQYEVELIKLEYIH